MTNILIADDDQHMLKFVEHHLATHGYSVYQAQDGIQALAVLKKYPCELAVVDVMMPFMDGYELTKEIRRRYDIPIILLTAKAQIEDKEQGFFSGTDDYLVKPFEPKELVYRIKALLRRYAPADDESSIQIGQTKIDKKSYEVQIHNQTLLLPLKEFELLFLLMSHPLQVFSREQLIEQIWGSAYQGDDRTVDVHIKRLRERFRGLSDDFQIKTVRGVGYLLEEKRQ